MPRKGFWARRQGEALATINGQPFQDQLLRNGEELAARAIHFNPHWAARIDRAGGLAQAFGGRLRITFPENAVVEPLELEIAPPLTPEELERTIVGPAGRVCAL